MHENVPFVQGITESVYRFVAKRRSASETACSLLQGNVAAPATFHLTRRVFLRCLGLVYLMDHNLLVLLVKPLDLVILLKDHQRDRLNKHLLLLVIPHLADLGEDLIALADLDLV